MFKIVIINSYPLLTTKQLYIVKSLSVKIGRLFCIYRTKTEVFLTKQTKVIAICNQKGDVTKTTSFGRRLSIISAEYRVVAVLTLKTLIFQTKRSMTRRRK